MPNVEPNKGRRLRLALSRFAAMLIEEARYLSQFTPSGFTNKVITYEELDAHLFCDPDRLPPKKQPRSSGSMAYSKYPPGPNSRAPNADFIQNLELRVAKFVGRPSHTVVVENNALISEENLSKSLSIGPPISGLNLRDYSAIDFQLGYQNDWPTFRRLRYLSTPDGQPLFSLYAWQYSRVWDAGLIPYRAEMLESLNLPADTPTKEMIETATQQQLNIRNALAKKMQKLPEICRE